MRRCAAYDNAGMSRALASTAAVPCRRAGRSGAVRVCRAKAATAAQQLALQHSAAPCSCACAFTCADAEVVTRARCAGALRQARQGTARRLPPLLGNLGKLKLAGGCGQWQPRELLPALRLANRGKLGHPDPSAGGEGSAAAGGGGGGAAGPGRRGSGGRRRGGCSDAAAPWPHQGSPRLRESDARGHCHAVTAGAPAAKAPCPLLPASICCVNRDERTQARGTVRARALRCACDA